MKTTKQALERAAKRIAKDTGAKFLGIPEVDLFVCDHSIDFEDFHVTVGLDGVPILVTHEAEGSYLFHSQLKPTIAAIIDCINERKAAPPMVTLYEDNAGHLTMTCGGLAFTGFERMGSGADIIADAKALAAGDTSDWTLDACDPDDEHGFPVATVTIAHDSTHIEFSAGLAGVAALRYVGGSADEEAPKSFVDECGEFNLRGNAYTLTPDASEKWGAYLADGEGEDSEASEFPHRLLGHLRALRAYTDIEVLNAQGWVLTVVESAYEEAE